MNEALDHTRCSELLGAYAAGELDTADARRVDGHLAGCARCRAELDALVALRSSPVAEMTAEERARLHARVWSALGHTPERAPRPRRPWAARLAPALAAAALVVIAGAGVSVLSRGGGDGDAGAAQEAVGGGGADAASPRLEEQTGGLETVRRRYFFELPGDATDAALGALGARAPRVSAASAAEREANADILLGRIEASAPNEATARQVRRCGRVALEREPGLVPLAGATARRDGERVLVLTFASPRRGTNEVWAWRAGSCSDPVRVRAAPRSP